MVNQDVEEGTPPDDLSLDSTREGGNNLKLQLHLLENEPKKLPRWMKHYGLASYIICSIIALYSIAYLIFIGIHQANPRMQIQYTTIVRYLEYNSYSILSPLLCPLLMAVLMYHVKYRTQLDEGDFFGIEGLLLLLALVNVHDSWGILKLLQWNRDHDLRTKSHIDPPPVDDTSRNDFHWQYAWSTRTTCARNFVRDLQYKYEYSKKHVVRQIIFQTPEEIYGPVARTGTDAPPPEPECNDYHDIKSKAKIRKWMKDLQNEFKCCGPYGYEEWKTWFDNEASTGCNKKWIKNINGNPDIPSCFDPLMKWLDVIMLQTYWIMLTQAVLYLISMVVLGLHHSAMKFEVEKVEKRYSLLSLTDNFIDPEPHWWSIRRPASKAMVIGNYPPKPTKEEEEEQNRDDKGAVSAKNSTNKGKADDTSDGKSSRKKKIKKKP